MSMKSLDQKLAMLHADPDAPVFILADAKDADMAFGVAAPGRSPEAASSSRKPSATGRAAGPETSRSANGPSGEDRFRTLVEFRDIVREIVRQELVDIMLMSASMSDVLTIQERVFESSKVTPAVRANDTTDIHAVRGGKYVTYPSMPFRTATLDHIQCGHLDCDPNQRYVGANLGLYSVTFNNDPERDRRTLEEYTRFRLEAERKRFRHFLEVFDPNVPNAVAPDLLPKFVNDMIARCLAGVPESGRPLFLKMVYHGPRSLEELHRYDPSLVIGILGGSAGTTYDAFKLLAEAQKYGARVALFGRKINNAENQFLFIRFLRLITDGAISPEEAVPAYHAALAKLGVRPHRTLQEDMQLQTGVMSYGGSTATVTVPAPVGAAESSDKAAACACHCGDTREGSAAGPSDSSIASNPTPTVRETFRPRPAGPEPDFAHMTASEKLAYHRANRDRVFG
jgi:hypothetical protein